MTTIIQDDEPMDLPGASPVEPPMDLPSDSPRDVPVDPPVPVPSDVPFDAPGDVPPTDDDGGLPLERPPVEPHVQPDAPLTSN